MTSLMNNYKNPYSSENSAVRRGQYLEAFMLDNSKKK